jgi:dihydroorotate dehydrogenase
MYDLFFRLALQHIDPERAHALAERSLRAVRSTAVGRAAVRAAVGVPDRCLQTHALGLNFPTPVGVAAGLDKDGTWFEDLAALGFGFVEVGTLTAEAQDGNPPPRIVRFPTEHALLNKMGFPNPGARAVASRLTGRETNTVVGVNVGKSRSVSLEAAGQDYRAAVRLLGPVSDYLVLNVSSPNTPALRAMQALDRLRQLIADVRQELSATAVPLLIKIDPDLDDGQVDGIVGLALELELDGLVAVNTSVDRSLVGDAAAPFDGGGVSGQPLRDRSVEILRRIRRVAGERVVVISVGGVETAGDVWERILAGATLVQVYTSFVYRGPSWPKRVNRELARMVRAAGASSIQELVGAGDRHTDILAAADA